MRTVTDFVITFVIVSYFRIGSDYSVHHLLVLGTFISFCKLLVITDNFDF